MLLRKSKGNIFENNINEKRLEVVPFLGLLSREGCLAKRLVLPLFGLAEVVKKGWHVYSRFSIVSLF